MEIMGPKEAWIRLHTQEVRGSSPCAPTIPSIRGSDVQALEDCRLRKSPCEALLTALSVDQDHC